MTEMWYPPALKDALAPESILGQFTGGAPKGVLHTTEAWTGKVYAYSAALGVYKGEGFWPHFTPTIEHGTFEVHQHIALNRPARALEHPAGTGDTNNDNCIQIEISWGANRASEMPDLMLNGLAALMRWIEANHGVARVAPLPFGVGPNRPTWAFWHATSGWFGHQHVPANHHVDPGPVPIARLLSGAPTPVPDQEDEMQQFPVICEPGKRTVVPLPNAGAYKSRWVAVFSENAQPGLIGIGPGPGQFRDQNKSLPAGEYGGFPAQPTDRYLVVVNDGTEPVTAWVEFAAT